MTTYSEMLRPARLLAASLCDSHEYVYFCLAHTRSDVDDEWTYPSLVKIGYTANPQQRLSAIRRGGTTVSPHWITNDRICPNVNYLGIVPGNKCLESELHFAFAGVRALGEWFYYEPIAADVTSFLFDYKANLGCLTGCVGAWRK